jgi:hypothetical protein
MSERIIKLTLFTILVWSASLLAFLLSRACVEENNQRLDELRENVLPMILKRREP